MRKISDLNDAELLRVIYIRDMIKLGRIMPLDDDFLRVRNTFGLQGRPCTMLKDLDEIIEGEITRRGNHANIA